jgi:hypothetical protein
VAANRLNASTRDEPARFRFGGRQFKLIHTFPIAAKALSERDMFDWI